MPKNTNILLIRHGEKPAVKSLLLSVAGQERAQAYAIYFQNFPGASAPLKLSYLFATKKSPASNRPFLTIEPLSNALKLPINHKHGDKDYKRVADDILTPSKYDNSNILICWHHGKILQLAHKLGAPKSSLPTKWPGDVFGWLIHLSFDSNGDLQTSVINEQLMYDDYGNDPKIGK
jgi:hypothetical protein